MNKKAQSNWLVVVILGIIVLSLVGGITYFGVTKGWFKGKEPPPPIPVKPVQKIIKFIDGKTKESLEANYQMYELKNNELVLLKEGIIGKDSQELLEIPLNRTFEIYGWTPNHYKQFLAVRYPDPVSTSVSEIRLYPFADDLEITLDKPLEPFSTNNVVVSINTSNQFRRMGMCLKWSFSTIYAKNHDLTEISAPYRLIGQDQCYDIDQSTMDGVPVNITLEVKNNAINPSEYLYLTVFDRERVNEDKKSFYRFEDSDDNDVGGPDYTIDLFS